MSRIRAGLAVTALASAMTAGMPAATAAAQCAVPAGVYRGPVGWAQRLLDPARIWPLANGSGQLVAVIGTGVDVDNPQFAPGQVTGSTPDADQDCDGRGTFAAGIVAAQGDPTTTFTGIAPGAGILSLKFTAGDEAAPDTLAEAIRDATNAGATVILVVVPVEYDSPALTDAVTDAVARNVVVVAAAAGERSGAVSYPASLPGVLAVGAIDAAGTPVQDEAGDHVALAAPGKDLVATSAGAAGTVGHRWGVNDPTFAAAYVAGAVALLRSYRPDLTAAQVRTRLLLTASRPADGGHDPQLGWGVLDAYAAVTAELPPDAPGPEANQPVAPQETIRPEAAPQEPVSHDRAPGLLAVLGVFLASIAAAGAATVRRGRARGWRPGVR
jgi:membrane-anchored mycosin MYCP